MNKKQLLVVLTAFLAVGCGHSISGSYQGSTSGGQQNMYQMQGQSQTQTQSTGVNITMTEKDGSVNTTYVDPTGTYTGTLKFDGNSAITGSLTGAASGVQMSGGQQQQATLSVNWTLSSDSPPTLTGIDSSTGGFGGFGGSGMSSSSSINAKCVSGDCS